MLGGEMSDGAMVDVQIRLRIAIDTRDRAAWLAQRRNQSSWLRTRDDSLRSPFFDVLNAIGAPPYQRKTHPSCVWENAYTPRVSASKGSSVSAISRAILVSVAISNSASQVDQI
jgi:hypothetical protein